MRAEQIETMVGDALDRLGYEYYIQKLNRIECCGCGKTYLDFAVKCPDCSNLFCLDCWNSHQVSTRTPQVEET